MTSPANFNTPGQIIESAYQEAGILMEGELPNGEQIVKGMRRLIGMINLWQTQGLKLWLQEDLPITMTAGTSLYTLGPTGTIPMVRPTRVVQAYVEQSTGTTRPLMLISRQEWTILSNRTQEGAINSVFVDKQQLTLNINLWLTPDATAALDTLHLVVQNQVTNFTSLTETVNFPVEWNLALCWGLANELTTGQPVAVINRCAMMSKFYREALENWDVEDADTFFTVDTMGNFRRTY